MGRRRKRRCRTDRHRYGDRAGHTCLAVAGPAIRTFTLETGNSDRQANMVAFAARGLELFAEAVEGSQP